MSAWKMVIYILVTVLLIGATFILASGGTEGDTAVDDELRLRVEELERSNQRLRDDLDTARRRSAQLEASGRRIEQQLIDAQEAARVLGETVESLIGLGAVLEDGSGTVDGLARANAELVREIRKRLIEHDLIPAE